MPSSLSTITSSISKVKVSPNVLKMQFMKKTMVKLEQEERAWLKLSKVEEPLAKPATVYSTAETIEDEPTCSLGGIMTEERFTVLEDLRFGRFSYQKQNPDIEKLMILHECRRLGIDPPEEEDADEDGELKEEEGEQESAAANRVEMLDQWQGSRSALTEDTTPTIRCIKQTDKRQKFNNNKKARDGSWHGKGGHNKQTREGKVNKMESTTCIVYPGNPSNAHIRRLRGVQENNKVDIEIIC
uniref:Uncharacterized protein n=1 Tax=Ditylenchus dipsaci TaxID=166011 RepID=A0A915DDI6_9BILA